MPFRRSYTFSVREFWNEIKTNKCSPTIHTHRKEWKSERGGEKQKYKRYEWLQSVCSDEKNTIQLLPIHKKHTSKAFKLFFYWIIPNLEKKKCSAKYSKIFSIIASNVCNNKLFVKTFIAMKCVNIRYMVWMLREWHIKWWYRHKHKHRMREKYIIVIGW